MNRREFIAAAAAVPLAGIPLARAAVDPAPPVVIGVDLDKQGRKITVDVKVEQRRGSTHVARGGTRIRFDPPFDEIPILIGGVPEPRKRCAATMLTNRGCTLYVFDSATGNDVGGLVMWIAASVEVVK